MVRLSQLPKQARRLHHKYGFPIHFDRTAFEADHVVVCNRVKPHTGFAGPIESGLMKMLTIGLGNPEGAMVYHRAILDFGFDQIVRGAAAEVLAKCHILAGVAIVENAYDQTARIEAVPPEQFEARESELLVLAKRWLPRLPFPQVDVLLIDRIGKEISGTGLDPNVVGRKFNDHKAVEDEFPKVKRIAVRGLTPQSHGNAIGLGMAEFCRSQLLGEIDVAATRLNGLTSGHISAVMTPLGLRDRPRNAGGRARHDRPGRAAGREAPMDRRHAAPERVGVFRRVSRRSPAAARLGDSQRTAICRSMPTATCRLTQGSEHVSLFIIQDAGK